MDRCPSEKAKTATFNPVDLNPIRAATATIPEQSDYTSGQERIKHPDSGCLAPFSDQGNATLPFNLKDYLELVDWGGREVKRNKRGYIPASAPPILVRLKMNSSPVLKYMIIFSAKYN